MLRSPNGSSVPRVLTASTAAGLGYTPARVRGELDHGRWTRLARAVYLSRPDDPTRADWAQAGLLVAGPGAVLSGWDGVRARGLGDGRPPTGQVLVLTRSGGNRVVGGVRFRRSRRTLVRNYLRLVEPDGPVLAVASTARCVADAALTYRFLNPVRALVTSSVQRRLCSAAELRAELESGPQNGSAFLRIAVEDALLGAQSIAEAELAAVLRAGHLPMPEFNVPILTSAGEHIATADALWRGLRAVLEVDSRKHHFEEEKWLSTMRRHNLLTSRGLALTHYAPADIVQRPRTVVSELARWLRGRAAELAVDYRAAEADPRLRGQPFVLAAAGS